MTLHNFSGYNPYEAAKSKGADAIHISGLGASDNSGRLIDQMERLGLIEQRMAAACKTLHAANGDLQDFLHVSTHVVDRGLAKTDASVEEKIAFKAQLHRKGWLVQSPR